MSSTPTVIYHAASPQQAHILKGVLEERGIAAWIVNDNLQIAGGELPLGWRAAAQVVVGQMHAADARRIAEEFDRTTAHDLTANAPAEPEPAVWQDWPICPQCGARRQVRCSVCGLPGINFPLAAIEERDGEPMVLLICQSCDDHFRPEMFRLCHQCGYDYGAGLSVDGVESPGETNFRLWLVMGGLGLVAAALAGYFYALWR